MHELQPEATVGPASDPHMSADPASHAGGGGHPPSGPLLVPPMQALLSGTHTLACSPLYVASIVHVRPTGHGFVLLHGAAQNESP